MEKKMNEIVVDNVTYNEYQVRRLIDCEKRLNDLEKAMSYDYEYEMKKDVREYIESNYGRNEIVENLAWNGRSDWASSLYDDMFSDDSVTGNASGSYTCNSYRAGLYLLRNIDLYEEACNEFGREHNGIFSNEAADVTIRCYLLGGVIDNVLSDMEDELADEIEAYENRDDEDEENED